MGHLVFLLEAETAVRQRIQFWLEQAGYSVQSFSTIRIVPEAEMTQPRLILCALKMPDGSGLELYRRLRKNPRLSATPLIFLFNPAVPDQYSMAFESGANGLLPNSVTSHDLIAYIRAVLNRQGAASAQPHDLLIDVAAMRISVRGEEVQVTSLEFRLIEYLSKHRGQVFTRDQLLDAVWGDTQFVTPRTVDACIRRIRKKIEPDPDVPTLLKTVRGTGYRVDAIGTWQLPANEDCECKTCKAAVTSNHRARRRA
jgi:two-component system phosphate regulon response regulator PhoB